MLVSACRKSSDKNTVPRISATTTSILQGVITPRESTIAVEAIKAGSLNPSARVTPDAGSGAFEFLDLSAGSYTVRVIATPMFTPINDLTINLESGQRKDVGILYVYPLSAGPTIYYNVNDAAKKGVVTIQYASPKLSIAHVDIIKRYAGTAEQMIDQYTLDINLDNITETGTYICDATTSSYVNYVRAVPSTGIIITGRPWITWSSLNTGGSARVVITSIDTVAKTISGTLTATLISANYSKTLITNCVFKAPYK